MIVDDDPLIIMIMEKMIRKKGHDVVTIRSSGDRIAERITEESPDLILMDIFFEDGFSGIEMVRSIQEQFESPPPVIYMTSSKDEEIMNAASETGPIGYILKPLEPFHLLTVVESALNFSRIEKKIRESENKYRALFTNLSSSFVYFEVVYEHDIPVNLRVIDANKVFENLTGKKLELIRGSLFTEVFSPDLMPESQLFLDTALQVAETGESLTYEMYVPYYSRWANITIHEPVKGFVASITENTTEKKRYLQEIENKEKYYRDIVELANSLILRTDGRGNISFANDRAEAVLGINREDIKGKSAYDLLFNYDEEKIDEVRELFRKAIKNDEKDVYFEVSLKSPLSDFIWIRWSSRLLYDEKGELVETLNVGFDKTDQKILEIEKDRAFKLNSYRIKQLELLSAISAYMQEKTERDELIKKIVKIIPSGFRRPSDISCRLMYNSKIYSGTSSKQQGPFIKESIYVNKLGKGFIEITGKPGAENGNNYFLNSERELVKIISENLGKYLEGLELEEKIRENYHFLGNLLEFIPFGIYTTDLQGRYTLSNSEFAHRVFGIGKDELIGKNMEELKENFQGLNFAYHIQQNNEFLSRPEIDYQYEDEILNLPDGRVEYIVHYRKTLYDKSGNPSGIIGINVVRTEEKKRENEIKSAYRYINNIIDSIESILIGANTNDEIIIWNKKAEEIFAIPASDAVGKKVAGFDINWDWSKIYSGIADSISSDDPVFIDNLVFTSKEGQNRLLGISINAIKDEGGIFDGFLIFGADITERKKAEAEFMQAQKLQSIGQLAAGIAHEINTPVQYVSDNIHFLKNSFSGLLALFNDYRSIVENDKYDKTGSESLEAVSRKFNELDGDFIITEIPGALSQCLDGLAHITRIVKSMRNLSHPEKADISSINLNQLIQDVKTISRNEWKYAADFEVKTDDSIPLLSGYAGDLSGVFLNLIINSVHAIEEAIESKRYDMGRIVIETQNHGDRIKVLISDNGMGIPEKIKNRIFDPFFTTKQVGKGTGQGLSISHSIIYEKHGGSIEVESEYGSGTQFTLSIPVKISKEDSDG